MKTFAVYSIQQIVSDETLKDFEGIPYNPVIQITFNSYLPNKRIPVSGNCFIAMNATASGDTGIVAIQRITGNEQLTFNGFVDDSNNYPTGPGTTVFMQYVNVNGSLYWILLNNNTNG